MVSAPNSRLRCLVSSPGQGHCVVFLRKTLYSHSASLHPGVLRGSGKLSGKTDKMLEGWEPVMD